MTVAELIKRFEKLKSSRGTWESHWQELAEYCLPRKATVTALKTPGTKVPTDIYDSTQIQSAQIFAAGLMSYLTNPSSKWFALGLKNKNLEEASDVKMWLKDTEDRIFDTLNESNFNQEIYETYLDLSVFGTSPLYSEEDPETKVRFYARPLAETFIVENDRKKVDTLFRAFSYTVRQAFQRWGNNAGQKVLEAYEQGKLEEDMDFLHVILPRAERDVRKQDGVNKPFASLYIEPTTKKLLSEGGYEEFPFFVPRLTKISGEVYGRSPAMTCLPDIKSLNSMAKTILKAAQKQVDPPLQAPDDGYILPLRTSPGSVNYHGVGLQPGDEIKPLYPSNIHNIPIGFEMEEQKRASIKSTFFVDLFLLLAQQPKMTATEVLERVNEKMLILGPMLGRLMSELLDPVITRVASILSRTGGLAPLPPTLQNEDFKVKYISPLAKAQKASEMKSISTLLLAVQEMAQVDPSALDNVNLDQAVKEIADIVNVPANILRSDEEVQEMRKERQQQLEVQQTLALANQAADTAQKGARAEKELTSE